MLQKQTTKTLHAMPADIQKALNASADAKVSWKSLTALARNEWICWTISVKKDETRIEHVKRVVEDLENGKRRPCCWAGCIHR